MDSIKQMHEVADENALIARYTEVKENIVRAARHAGRDPASLHLVIASKTQPVWMIEALINAGHRLFGENRVQEAQDKWDTLKVAHPDVKLHLIGPLQTNKVREAVRLFDVIETVDRERLARALAREQSKQNKNLSYMLEVNVGAETQKSGVMPEQSAALLGLCRNELGLNVEGLMCIPPANRQASPYFALLAKLASENGLSQLSMGMTADYPIAIELGATHVRIGTAIFGSRR